MSDIDYRALALCREEWEAGRFAVFARATDDGGAVVVTPSHLPRRMTADVLRKIAEKIEQGEFTEIRKQ